MGLVDALIVRIDNLIRSRLDAAISSRLASNDSRLNTLDVLISSRLSSADSRIANLDAAISSRLPSSDSRLANLDALISSRLASNDSRLDYIDAAISSGLQDKAQKPYSARMDSTDNEIVLMNNVSGPGRLIGLLYYGSTNRGLKSLKINIDNSGEVQLCDNSSLYYSGVTGSGPFGRFDLNLRFKTSCTVKAAGSEPSYTIRYNCIYALDI